MPAIWTYNEKAPVTAGAFSESGDAPPPLARALLRPNRSLSRSGLAWLLVVLWGFLMVPLFPLLGVGAFWVMLPFVLGAVAALWYFIERNNKDGALYEELLLWHDSVSVTRHAPGKAVQCWQANPFWVSVTLKAAGGPVDNYLTLRGNGREIELGAFLSPEERATLRGEVERALRLSRQPPAAI